MNPTVVLLSTYPIVEPRHGGQVRLANIAQTFREAGWNVQTIAVYEPAAYKSGQTGKSDIPLPVALQNLEFNGRYVPMINDLLAGKYAASDEGGFPSVLNMLPKRIDAVHAEQPWLWPLAKKIKTLPELRNPLLVYGSQNIEAPLKREILESCNIGDIDDVIDAISDLEYTAAREADLTLAVTKADLETLTLWGAKNPVLAPNGISHSSADHKRIEKWKKRLPDEPWLLYIASDHPPNFTAFTRCVGDSLGCIPPTSKLVIAGRVCEHLYKVLSATRWSSLNQSRLELLGVLSDEDLAAVKMLAHAFILPIPHGGGSNIKTAEALYSGAYVIGTKEAFRGFEKFVSLPEVMIADSPDDFQDMIRQVLTQPARPQDINSHMREGLLWNKCLASIPAEVQKLIDNK